MKGYQLAWRNLWRNRRRTLITAASVFFALFFALLLRSFQLGTYGKVYTDIISSYSGYLQLQHPDYLDEPVLDNSFNVEPGMVSLIEQDPNVTSVEPRIETFALAAAGSRTSGVMIMGIDPGSESTVLNLRNRVLPGHDSVAGNFLTDDESGYALIGSALSAYLGAGIGDTLVLMGQGYHGVSAAGLYQVKGILEMPSPDIDSRLVCLTLNDVRWLYDMPGMATSATIGVRESSDRALEATVARLRAITGSELALRSWKEINALLVNQLEADRRSGAIMIGILYLVIAFGVFGTVLMMMAERRREFAMLISVGMRRGRLAAVTGLEMLLMGLLGVVAGVIASLPVVIAGHVRPLRFTGEMARMFRDYGFDPVMPTQLPGVYYLWQTVVVLLIVVIAIAFCTRRILRMNIISTLKG